MAVRAFIVGNGPSLDAETLDKLKGEVCFGVNRINTMYDKTDWRPTHYVRSEGMELVRDPDPELWAEDALYHLNDPNITTWMNPYFRIQLGKIGMERKWVNAIWIGVCTHYLTHYDKDDCPVTWHLPMLCGFGSSVNVAIQIAVTLGYGPLYLVGCDLGYKDGQPSHCTEDYEKGYEDMLRPARYANMDTLMAHIIAKRSSPVPIYNCTKGGYLEAYERMSLDEALGDRKR